MPGRALVVEDDAAVRQSVALVLEGAGFAVEAVGDGHEALRRSRADGFDLVVLDLLLPSLHGFEVCRGIRAHSLVPIIILTAQADTADLVTGLELGADDYLVKPVEPEELVARARAAVRRADAEPDSRWTVRDLDVDEGAFRVSRAGEEVRLSATELRLLIALASQPDRVMTREDLLEQVWGYDYLGDSRLVDMAVLRLRAKLGEPPSPPAYVETVRSVGYRFPSG